MLNFLLVVLLVYVAPLLLLHLTIFIMSRLGVDTEPSAEGLITMSFMPTANIILLVMLWWLLIFQKTPLKYAWSKYRNFLWINI